MLDDDTTGNTVFRSYWQSLGARDYLSSCSRLEGL